MKTTEGLKRIIVKAYNAVCTDKITIYDEVMKDEVEKAVEELLKPVEKKQEYIYEMHTSYMAGAIYAVGTKHDIHDGVFEITNENNGEMTVLKERYISRWTRNVHEEINSDSDGDNYLVKCYGLRSDDSGSENG